MIEGRLIVCIGSSWDYDPTSKHQIMRILSRRNEILWVNYHGSRRPAMTGIDLRDAWSALARVTEGMRRAAPSITQLTPLVIPGAKSAVLGGLHRRLLIAQIRSAIRALRNEGLDSRPIQVWTFAPDVPYLAGAFNEECFLYYCTDEYTKFEGFDGRYIERVERELMHKADVVVTTSEPLWNTKRAHRPDCVLMRHGVDYDHFASAWRRPPAKPDDITGVPGPIFGFFGVIHHWIDRALLDEVARLRQQYSFVLIGECKDDVTALRRRENVYLLGRRPYDQLPAYCAAFDAALLPFAPGPMTNSVNPVKLYEYLAAGLPVVSTPLPEAQRFADAAGTAVTIADTAESFAAACDRMLARAADRESISRLVQDESWTAKVEELSRIIEEHPSRTAVSTHLPVTSPLDISSTAERSIAGLACEEMSRVGDGQRTPRRPRGTTLQFSTDS